MDIEWKFMDWDFILWFYEVVGVVIYSVVVVDFFIDICCLIICRIGNGGYKKEIDVGVLLM